MHCVVHWHYCNHCWCWKVECVLMQLSWHSVVGPLLEMVSVQEWIDSNQLFQLLPESFSQWRNILQFIWFCLARSWVARTVLNVRWVIPHKPVAVKARTGHDRITIWVTLGFLWPSVMCLCKSFSVKINESINKPIMFIIASKHIFIFVFQQKPSDNRVSNQGGFLNDTPSSLLVLAAKALGIAKGCSLNTIKMMKFQDSGQHCLGFDIYKEVHRTSVLLTPSDILMNHADILCRSKQGNTGFKHRNPFSHHRMDEVGHQGKTK